MSFPQPAPADDGTDDVLLHYTAHNPCGKSTIVLIHGACASGQDWDLVVPHLSESYHLLVPDMPGHGQCRKLTPFTVEYSSRLLERLIRKHAVNGRAHIVGHSLGAHIAINPYPQVVDAVFVSGYEVFPRTIFTRLMPYAFWTEHRIENLIPRPVIRWLIDGTDIPRGEPHSCSLDLCRQAVPAIIESEWPSPWPARTLIVAAGKSGVVPSNDHPQDAIKLMGIGRLRNPDTIAFTHPAMRHPWNRQAPKLFAETARAWFEISSGFEKL
ncbi:alpha/beta-hydrolase [Lipomyces kononenkoae]|uniref:Alpha/beta-hydrolase n=1 Tax=Lipomyces kononenkoae TaxID=34357 RepID=A0ACC3TA75_LIPKO